MRLVILGGSGAPRAMLNKKREALNLRGRAAVSLTSPAERPIHLNKLGLFALMLLFSSCATPDRDHHVVISTKDQQLALLEKGNLVAVYPVSTSKFGLGDIRGTGWTPLGELEIADKIGGGAPIGAVFKDRRRTSEVVPVDSPGRDPIVTRILWLRGREAQNTNAYTRMIYIHGTPEERNIGRPASYGCIRMRSADVIQLYDVVGHGAQVSIVDAPLAAVVPSLNAQSQVAGTNSTGGATSLLSH